MDLVYACVVMAALVAAGGGAELPAWTAPCAEGAVRCADGAGGGAGGGAELPAWTVPCADGAVRCADGAGGGAGGGAELPAWTVPCADGAVRCADGAGCARGYCDGRAECADGSDEPLHCTPCNRTLQGSPHVEYRVSLGGGGGGRLPFLCHLTFSARGGVVQLTFLEFSVGRHEPDGPEPCPDGQVSVAELGRVYPGGAWCGSGGAGAQYYSEAATLTLTVRLQRLVKGQPFALALAYRFIPLNEAVVRMGVGGALERGAATPGTYCTRTFSECHKRTCRLQSPNYPGMYPRNVSCYWTVWQKDIPTCKHAMISIQQDVPFKIQIKRSVSMARMNKTRRLVRAWGACGGGGARLLVYDGASTDDPLLLEWCGGDSLPAVTARGPAMLVAFHAAPRAAPPPPPPAAFEIDVRVVFADADSLEYAREPTRCEFHVKAQAAGTGGAAPRRGVLRAPRHTLPPNTTCTWTFHGRPGDLVWVYFASFTEYSLVEPRRELETEETSPPSWTRSSPHSTPSPWTRLRELLRAAPAASLARSPAPPAAAGPGEACAVHVRVWDGGGALHDGCGAGRLCARASLANATRSPRPCAPPDGYVSRGPLLTLAVSTRPGTATHPLRFTLHYEFADTRLPGVPWEGVERRVEPAECARVLTADGAVWSPRSPLWLGRGGARRLHCVTRLEGGPADGLQRARLELHQVSLGGAAPRCVTRAHTHTGRPTCHPAPDLSELEAPPDPDGAFTDFDLDEHALDIDKTLRRVPHLKIYETPWPGYRVEVACFCDNMTWIADNTTTSGSRAEPSPSSTEAAPLTAWGVEGWSLELVLWGGALSVQHDARALRYAGTWRRVHVPACARRRPPRAPATRLRLRTDACGASPYLLAAPAPRSVLLRARGTDLPLDAEPDLPCRTADRLLLYEPHSGRLIKAICPGEDESQWVQAFSAEWWSAGGGGGGGGGALLAAWEGGGGGGAALSALHVWRAAHNASCARACPELDACIAHEAWCDGWADCPRGGDEEGGCGLLLARLAAAARGWGAAGGAVGGAAAALLALCVGAGVLAARRRNASRRRKRADSLLRSAASTPAS